MSSYLIASILCSTTLFAGKFCSACKGWCKLSSYIYIISPRLDSRHNKSHICKYKSLLLVFWNLVMRPRGVSWKTCLVYVNFDYVRDGEHWLLNLDVSCFRLISSYQRSRPGNYLWGLLSLLMGKNKALWINGLMVCIVALYIWWDGLANPVLGVTFTKWPWIS